MKSFKLVINAVFDEIELDIIDYVKEYFKNADYSIDIVSVNSAECTDIDKMDKISKEVPDALINIYLNANKKSTGVSIYDKLNVSKESKTLAKALIDSINAYVNNLDKDEDISYNKSYMCRLRPFATVSINIGIPNQEIYEYLENTNDSKKAIAKAIYKAITTSYIVPKNDQDCLYTATANLNMKNKPDKTGEYIITVPKTSCITVLERTNNVYWKIKAVIDGAEYIGYCAQTYIKIQK